MTAHETGRALAKAASLATEYVESLPERHVGAKADADEVAAALGWDLQEEGQDAENVIEDLVRAVDRGLVASAGPRYFGFVVGGALPASVAADWLTAAWDQNAVLHAASPAAAAVEQVAGRWMLDLLGLPADASVGLPVGTGLGNTVGLAAARHALLAGRGWDVEAQGLYGAPEIAVVVSDDAHATLRSALQFLGLGRERVHVVPTDAQGRMIASEAIAVLDAIDGPVIACVQAGNVNTGSFDPIAAIADRLSGRDEAWLHVDGAFGLWAAASPATAHLVAGIQNADSWATDAHKWLNVGYDCGFVAVRDVDAHRCCDVDPGGLPDARSDASRQLGMGP